MKTQMSSTWTFLISPGDIYPNRKVKLGDADITDNTRSKLEELYHRHTETFSKNKDIGQTTLIEMEIDMGDSLPVAQNPYTLPLKHHEWVRKEIEMLEKAGFIERSLSPWATPVIVVPKKSAPDEPPHCRLCVDYGKVNALQQEVKKTDFWTYTHFQKLMRCSLSYKAPKFIQLLIWDQDTTTHWVNQGIKGKVSVHCNHDQMGVQMNTFRTEPGPSIFSNTNRQSYDGL